MLEAEKNNQNCEKETYVFQNLLQEQEDMKNITLRNDGRYMGRKQIDGRKITVYGHTQKQCLQKLKQAQKTKEEKTKTKYTLEQWYNYWAETYKKPFIQYKNYLVIEQLFKEINLKLGKIELSKISTMQIQEFYNTYKTSRKKEKIILYLNACIQKAVDESIIFKNACKNVIRDRKLKFNKKPFSIEEQEKIIQAIKGTDIEYYIYLYILTGIRRNEVNNNITEWLNVKTNQLKAINEKQKNNITNYKYIDLNPNFVKLLLKNKNTFVLKSDNVYRKFKKILNNLNIVGDIHTLRHTFATNYYYLGIPEKLISTWMGHKTTDITKEVYIGVARKNYIERLNKLYNNLLYKF